MLLHTCNVSYRYSVKKSSNFCITRTNSRTPTNLSFNCVSKIACDSISISDIAEVLHNKVLIAATVSGAIGQFSKPFTSVLLYGRKFDVWDLVTAGGFPSSHSSVTVATATSLALERGFSDPIFGLAVVYACLTMYDAQGVRREVGTHARELNKVLIRTTSRSNYFIDDANDLANSFSKEEKINPLSLEEEGSVSSLPKPRNSSLLVKSNGRKQSNPSVRSESAAYQFAPFKESIGHTEIEVMAGAILGFFVTLAICPYL